MKPMEPMTCFPYDSTIKVGDIVKYTREQNRTFNRSSLYLPIEFGSCKLVTSVMRRDDSLSNPLIGFTDLGSFRKNSTDCFWVEKKSSCDKSCSICYFKSLSFWILI